PRQPTGQRDTGTVARSPPVRGNQRSGQEADFRSCCWWHLASCVPIPCLLATTRQSDATESTVVGQYPQATSESPHRNHSRSGSSNHVVRNPADFHITRGNRQLAALNHRLPHPIPVICPAQPQDPRLLFRTNYLQHLLTGCRQPSRWPAWVCWSSSARSCI